MLSKVTGPVRREGIASLLGKLPELPVSWVEDTDSQLARQGMSTLSIAELRAEQKKEKEEGKTRWNKVEDYDDWEEMEG